MGRKIRDITGQRFGRLTAIKLVGKKNRGAVWLCECDCGNFKEVRLANLVFNNTRSCGCLHLERATKHSECKNGASSEYVTWEGLKKRCLNSKNKSYKNYGGRGIKVCNRWLDPKKGFQNFLEDMGRKPSREYTIERKDNDGDYTPENCKWATRKEQNNNRRYHNPIEYKGEALSIRKWAEKLGIRYGALLSRIKRGWSIERAFTLKEN